MQPHISVWELPREVLDMDLPGDAGIFLNFAYKWRRARQLDVSTETYEECLFCKQHPITTTTTAAASATSMNMPGGEEGECCEISPCPMCDGSGNLPASLRTGVNRTILNAMEVLEFPVRTTQWLVHMCSRSKPLLYSHLFVKHEC